MLWPPIVSAWPDGAMKRPLSCQPPTSWPSLLSLTPRLLGPHGSSYTADETQLCRRSVSDRAQLRLKSIGVAIPVFSCARSLDRPSVYEFVTSRPFMNRRSIFIWSPLYRDLPRFVRTRFAPVRLNGANCGRPT